MSGRIQPALRTGFFSLLVMAVAIGLFTLCNRLDNKYTAPGPTAYGGVLLLKLDDLARWPMFYLVSGWEIYRGELLAPESFTDGARRVKEDVFIGQYGGFEGSDPNGNPDGSATYRIVIGIPPEPASYSLELPEIYSAYQLYVNGVPMERFGNPDPASYRPETGNSVATFQAKDSIEIIIAVTDFSYLYSGMVYPPAFGTPRAVMSHLNRKLVLRTAICAIALGVGVFYVILGALTHKGAMTALYGLLCFCFVGYNCYPVKGALLRAGMSWYQFENFCFCGMFLLVMLLVSRVSGSNGWITWTFLAFGTVVTLCAALVVLAPGDKLSILLAYSRLIGVYKWITALYLTVQALRALYHGRRGLVLIAGILVFDCALIMDRIYPRFEPIRIGWFTEIAGAILVVGIGIVMGQEVLSQYRSSLRLENRVASVTNLVDMQRAYYPLLLGEIEQARVARHDLRHHQRIIRELVVNRQLDELEQYLDIYASSSLGARPLQYSAHHVIDVILQHFAVLCEKQRIDFQVRASVPETLWVDDADLCSLLSNLLENSIEATARLEGCGEKWISIQIEQRNLALILVVENPYDGVALPTNKGFFSRKRPGREGVGTMSVRRIAEKYGGSASFITNNGEGAFRSEVVLGQLIADSEDP